MLAGVAMLVFGQGLRIVTIGLDYIKRGGKDGQIWADRLVSGGIYAHCRNPMYVGNIAISLGCLTMSGNVLALAIGGTFFLAAYSAITFSEENFLRGKFGAEFDRYCQRSPRWIPSPRHMLGLLRTIRSYRFDWPAVIVKEYGTIFVSAALALGVLAWKAQRTGELDQYWIPIAVGMAMIVAFWCFARFMKKGKGLKPRGTTLTEAGLEQHRRSIDAIDARLLALFNRRAHEVSSIFEIKRALNLPRFNEARTERIFARLRALNDGPLTDEQVQRIFDGVLRYFAFEHDRVLSPPLETESVETPQISVNGVGFVTTMAGASQES